MDITKIHAATAQDEHGIVVPIYQRNDEPYLGADGEPSTITVLGSESKRYKTAKDTITRRLLRNRATKLQPEDIARNRIDQAAAAIVDWHGWEQDGAPLPCTAENVKALLGVDHILEQVETGITGHASFFVNNSPT